MFDQLSYFCKEQIVTCQRCAAEMMDDTHLVLSLTEIGDLSAQIVRGPIGVTENVMVDVSHWSAVSEIVPAGQPWICMPRLLTMSATIGTSAKASVGIESSQLRFVRACTLMADTAG